MLRRSLGFARAVYRNHRQQVNLPRLLTYTVTFGCNARCIMCDSWKMPAKGDLTFDELQEIVPQLPRMDAVRLTGGEPFVRRDLPQIAALIQKQLKPLVLHVTTNGFLTDRIVEFCESRERSSYLQMLVSVDGMEEKHNHVRGSSIAWKSVMETLETLAPRQQELKLRLGVNQTIVDAEGVDHYRKLRQVLRPLKVFNNVVMAYDTSATYNLEQDVDVAPRQIGEFHTFGQFSRQDLLDLLREVEADLHELPYWERVAKRYYLRGIGNRLLRDHGLPNPACVALNSHLRIFPNGDVPTCQFNSKVVGNLRQQSFQEIWFGNLATQQRSWVRACPGCWAECEVLPSALYTLDLLKETPRRRRDYGQSLQPERAQERVPSHSYEEEPKASAAV